MKPRIIGIAGKAGAGKDTIADYLVSCRGYTKMSFAEPLKQMTTHLGAPLPKTREEKEGKHPILDVTWRALWQHLGTEGLRHLDPDVWVKLLHHRIKDKPHWLIVIADVRFENEAKYIRENGGAMWHVIRPDVEAVRTHSSENPVAAAPEDQQILNDKTGWDLLLKINEMMPQDE